MGRDEIRQLRPQVFLQDGGCLTADGEPRDDLSGNFATAACITFEDAEAAPQEFLTVYEAIRQCWELAGGNDPAGQLPQVVDEGFELTSGLLGKEVNPAIAAWVREWLPFVQNEQGVQAMLQHLSSVAQQYALVMSLKSQQ
jgi:hypothetical protein